MKINLLQKTNMSFHKTGLKIKKYSPEIFIAVGIVGVAVGAVMACKATIKASAIIEEAKDNIEKVHTCETDEVLNNEYSKEDAKKDLIIIYKNTGVELAKLYGPSIFVGSLSIMSIIYSNNILRKQNIAISAAYATVHKCYKDYRNRVIERFGTEVDNELKYNIKAKNFNKTVVDTETGKEKIVKNTVNVAEIDGYSDYARFFDEGSPNWEKDPEYNLMFLKAEQNYANDRLRARGYLFLNEVYERLGIKQTKAGQIVGWVYDTKEPIGDNYVDFGIYNTNIEKTRDFVNGYENVILLDFNVDGNILDLI